MGVREVVVLQAVPSMASRLCQAGHRGRFFLQQCAICSTASCDDAEEEEPEVLEQVVPQATRVELGKRLRRIKLRHRYGCGPATVELELADTSTWPIKTNASMIVQVLT